MGKSAKFLVGAAFTVIGLATGQAWLTSIGLSLVSAAFKKQKAPRGGMESNFIGTVEPRRIIFGTVKVGGMHNIPPISTGDDGEMGHADIVHCGHEVSDIRDCYIDQELIVDADIGAIAGNNNDGLVGGTGKYKNHMWLRRYLGTSTQTADYKLTQDYPSSFTTNFRLRGITHTVMTCKYNSRIFNSFPNLSVIVDGYKVYDPRLDTTKAGGSGSHREDTPSTWAFSSNPALIVRHYLVWEVGFSQEELSAYESEIMTAATTCDATVNIPGPSTQKRWTFNGELLATDAWEENLKKIVDSMEGNAVYVDGVWRISAGEWVTPDVTINMGDWVSPTLVRASMDRSERWNFVRPWYIDPDRHWQRVEAYPRRSTSYEAADGNERIPYEYEISGCASSIGTKHAEYEAQRHGEIKLRQSRNQISMTGQLRPEFAKLIPGRTVYVNDSTYGFVTKSFRVLSVEAGLGDTGVGVMLLEEVSTMWTDMAAAEYNSESVPLALDPGITLPSLTADPIVIVGPNTISFNITAGVPTTQPVGTEYIVVENANSNYPPTSGYGFEVSRGASTVQVIVRADANTRHYWMFAEVGTYRSGYRPTSAGIPVAPMSYGPATLAFTQQPTNVNTIRAGATDPSSAKWAPGVTMIPNTPYATWAGNNGTVTASWQVMSNWYLGANTPTSILPSTCTNNGSYVPTFYLPNTVWGYEQQHVTLWRLTIRDSVNTVQSGNFQTKWISGADQN